MTFLIAVAAPLLGTLVLGEEITPTALLGMVMIFAGLAVIDGRLLRRLLHRPRAAPSLSLPD